MPVQELMHQELKEKINGCAISVHQFVGPGVPGIVHKPALMIELE